MIKQENIIDKCGECPVFKNKSEDGWYLPSCSVLIKSGSENPAVNRNDAACNQEMRREKENKGKEERVKKIFFGLITIKY